MRIELDRNIVEHLSFCCKYAFHDDTDVCILCGEHSPAVCPLCNGEGEIEETRYRNLPAYTEVVSYTTCPCCKGEGWIEVDL